MCSAFFIDAVLRSALGEKRNPNQSAECFTYIAALEKPQVQFRQRSRNSGSLLGLSTLTRTREAEPLVVTRECRDTGAWMVSRSAAPSSLYDDSAIDLEELFRVCRTGPELWDSVSSLLHA